MKKFILPILLLALAAACNEKKTETVSNFVSSTIDSTACFDNLAAYDSLPDLQSKVNWLKENGDKVCPSVLYESAEKTHLIPSGSRIEQIGTSLKQSYGEINSLQNYKLYGSYVSFKTAPAGDLSQVIAVDAYNTDTACYSFALFRGIAAKYEINSSDTIEFIRARIDEETEKIIIKITKDGEFFYDFSHEPKSIEKSKPI
ncbi:MAG TPA: hypothetical protein VF581_04530 [Flavobacterium sp.]|jgi:hypothetical protein